MNKVEMFSKDVILELDEMKKVGMKVPSNNYELAKDMEEMEAYEESMSVSECADLLIQLADI